MSLRMWTKYLLEEKVTTRPVDDEGRREQVPCRVEERLPTAPWGEAYRLLRQRGLCIEQKTFLFKLVQLGASQSDPAEHCAHCALCALWASKV